MNRLFVGGGLILVILVGAVAGVGIGLPATSVGPVQTVLVDVPKPTANDSVWAVELDPGAATIRVGADAAGLVDGTLAYNVPDLKPVITTGTDQVTIKSGDVHNKIITGGTARNDWALKLGSGVPLRLAVNAGASDGTYELGGLSLSSLVWNQGAAAATVTFSRPNPIRLSTFDVTAGAASLTMRGLANANMGTATFKLGAANLTLAFDGTLAQDATITVEGGASSLTILSGGTPVQVETSTTGPGSVTKGDWTQVDTTFSSPEWATATGPRIMLHTTLGAGTVTLLTGK